jgi:hypothetical protein
MRISLALIKLVVTAQNLERAERVLAREYKSIRPEDALSIGFQDPCGYVGIGDCEVDAKDWEGQGKPVG